MREPKNVFIHRTILSLGVLIALYAGISTVNYLDKYLHLSDEILTYNGLVHAAKTGVPLRAPRPESVMFDPDSVYPVYDSHKFIIYFNVPAYFVVEAIGGSIEKWYGGWPFVVSMIILLIALWTRKKDPGPEELLVLFLPTILSSWPLSSLHFIRYYGFMYVFGILCAYASYRIYYSNRPYLLRVLVALLILLLPGLFHETLFSILGFGLIAMGVDFFTSGLYKRYRRRNLILGAVGLVVLLVIVAIVPAFRLNFAIERFFREWDPSTFWQAAGYYMEVNNPQGGSWSLFNLIVLFGGGYLSLKRSDFYGRFFRLTAGFFLFSLILYSMLMGGIFKPPYGFNRYYLILHVSYLISIGLFVYMLLDRLLQLLKKEVRVSYLLVGATAFAYLAVGNIFSPFTPDKQDFSLIPRYDEGLIRYTDSQLNNIYAQGREVIFISGQAELLQHYYPEVPSYSLRLETTMEELRDLGKRNPEKIFYIFLTTKPRRNDVQEFLLTIYPDFKGEMLVRGRDLVRAYQNEASRIKEKYGVKG